MDPIIHLFKCPTCEGIYGRREEALTCFRQGIIALEIPRGSFFKSEFEVYADEKDGLHYKEGESYFIAGTRKDAVPVGHYSSFAGISFKNPFEENNKFFIVGNMSPRFLKEMCAPEFREVKDYFISIRAGLREAIEKHTGITAKVLRRGRLELLPKDRRKQMESMRRALETALREERYEAAGIYSDGINQVQEQIMWAQHQR